MGTEIDFRDDLVRNAARLLGDARFLVGHSRHASGFALATLGLEEIGKLILNLWFPCGEPRDLVKRAKSHIRKQRAVASLLLGQMAVKNVGDAQIPNPAAPPEVIEALAKAMYESTEGRFRYHVDIGAVDKTKQLAMYRDQVLLAGIDASQFRADDVVFVLIKAKDAMTLLGDPKVMAVGKALYHTAEDVRPCHTPAFPRDTNSC